MGLKTLLLKGEWLPHLSWPLVTRGTVLRPVAPLAHKEVILAHKKNLTGEGEVLGALGGSGQSSQGWLPSQGRAGWGHEPWALGMHKRNQEKD